jgi:NADH dehydrogenase FAD-containing subunit
MSVSLVSKRHRVVVVGGGAGGIELAIGLARRADATTDEVVLIDKESSHLWKPRLHEVAAGLMSPGEDRASYLALAQAHGFRFHYGALASLDSSSHTIRLAAAQNTVGLEAVLSPRELDYDDLVLSFGSQVNDFGIEGVAEHCHILDGSAQASAFNRSFLNAAMQIAEGQREDLAVGIVGAGATGVELAAAGRRNRRLSRPRSTWRKRAWPARRSPSSSKDPSARCAISACANGGERVGGRARKRCKDYKVSIVRVGELNRIGVFLPNLRIIAR